MYVKYKNSSLIPKEWLRTSEGQKTIIERFGDEAYSLIAEAVGKTMAKEHCPRCGSMMYISEEKGKDNKMMHKVRCSACNFNDSDVEAYLEEEEDDGIFDI